MRLCVQRSSCFAAKGGASVAAVFTKSNLAAGFRADLKRKGAKTRKDLGRLRANLWSRSPDLHGKGFGGGSARFPPYGSFTPLTTLAKSLKLQSQGFPSGIEEVWLRHVPRTSSKSARWPEWRSLDRDARRSPCSCWCSARHNGEHAWAKPQAVPQVPDDV